MERTLAVPLGLALCLLLVLSSMPLAAACEGPAFPPQQEPTLYLQPGKVSSTTVEFTNPSQGEVEWFFDVARIMCGPAPTVDVHPRKATLGPGESITLTISGEGAWLLNKRVTEHVYSYTRDGHGRGQSWEVKVTAEAFPGAADQPWLPFMIFPVLPMIAGVGAFVVWRRARREGRWPPRRLTR